MNLSMTGVFMIAGAIDAGSPAQASGLRSGDLVHSFGPITKADFASVRKDIGPFCAKSINSPFTVVVGRRNGEGVQELLHLSVTPKKWSGDGLLGCHFYPLSHKSGAFLTVHDVQIGSPAYKADIRNKDRIIEFGTINAETFVSVEESILPYVHGCATGVDIPVLVMRKVFDSDEYVPLTVTSTVWEGPGLIGCRLRPIGERSSLRLFADKVTGGFVSEAIDDGIASSLEKKLQAVRVPELTHFSFPPFGKKADGKHVAFAG